MPIERKPLLFVSSTSDLMDERAAIESALPRSIEVYRYEQDTARRQPPRDRLRDVLESTDVFVGLLGARYGSAYPGCETDRSIVEWEFDTALARESTELLAFSKARSLSAVEPEQQKFLERLGDFSQGVWLKEFSNLDQLKNEVRFAVMDWLVQYWAGTAQTGHSNVKKARAIAALAGVGALAGILTAQGSLSDLQTGGLVAIAGALIVGALWIFEQ